MQTATTTPIAQLPWIKDARFDSIFIFGLLFMAWATGMVVAFQPSLFWPIVIVDLWILGYHHVIATYTRLCFDGESFKEHRYLILAFLPLVAAVTLIAAWQWGIWLIFTVYFYWQWWHYTRQSWGISRIYRGKDRDGTYEDGWLDQAIFYAIPATGIIWRSWQDQGTFLGQELWVVPTPTTAVVIAGVATSILMATWVVRRVMAARQGRLATVHTAYMLSHFTIFGLGYILIDDISVGWLAINIWHNAQYILFVWLFNTKRFSKGVDPKARFLSYISQPGRILTYMLTCLAITGVFYWGVIRTIDALFFAGLSATIVLYQIVNFHHYVVDSFIWKVRKPKFRETLDIKG